MRTADGLLLGLSAAAVACLAVAADQLDVPAVSLGDLPAWEGRAVAIEALVDRASPAGAGAQVLTLVDGSGRVTAFWPSPSPIEGAWVTGEGVVERVRGAWEVRLWQLNIVRERGAPLTVGAAARLAPLAAGEAIVVNGLLRISNEGATLEDDEAALAASVKSDTTSLADRLVVVRGAFRYDVAHASYRIEAWEVTLA
jgi:hypothetical protein